MIQIVIYHEVECFAMKELTLVFDPSSSLSKGIYSTEDPSKMKLLVMEPDVIPVEWELIKLHTNQSDPENEAWVKVDDQYYAVGYLARSQFSTYERLREAKYVSAYLKVLAMVGVIAKKEKYPSQFQLNLGILLPAGEYKDKESLQRKLTRKLENFYFQRYPYKIELKQFDCIPEGGGIVRRGIQNNPMSSSILILMMGYRNTSYLWIEKGKIKEGKTTELGFIKVLEAVSSCTPGLKPIDIVESIYLAGNRVTAKYLKDLVRQYSSESQKEKIKQISQSIKISRKQQWNEIKTWLNSCTFPHLDEVILAGGTANYEYYRNQLLSYFKNKADLCHWADKLEESAIKSLRIDNNSVKENQYPYRLTDIYGYYLAFQAQLQRKKLLGA